jgi:GcrA cell cycle regulator
VRLSAAEVHERLAALASRSWPIERLFGVWQARCDGQSTEQIAAQLGQSAWNTSKIVKRLLQSGLIRMLPSQWAADRETQFILLWNEDHSVGEISRRMGITRSAGIGKSHRLIAKGLIAVRARGPRRPHPDQSAEAKQMRLQKAQRDYRDRQAAAKGRPRPEPRPRRSVPIALDRPLAPPPAPRPAPYVPPPPVFGRVVSCCWPIGEPGKPAFHFCDKPSDPGRPYCHVHASKAYVRMPAAVRREARA